MMIFLCFEDPLTAAPASIVACTFLAITHQPRAVQSLYGFGKSSI